MRIPNPYDLVPNDRGYHFYTDLNYTYYVYFEQSTNYFSGGSNLNSITYGFGFECMHNIEDHVFDSRIEDTVIHCIHLFFKSKPECIIAYTCDGKDRYELLRYRLFNQWCCRHLTYCDRLNYKTLIGDSWFCGAILFQLNHAFREYIMASFYKEFND